jgi:hypothetical protein
MQLFARFTCAALWLICVSASSASTRTLTLPSPITGVEVSGRSMDVFRRIDSPAKIAQIMRFVGERRSGWETPWAGVPVPRFQAVLYHGKTCMGHFGVGPRFFETDLAGDFRSRPATDSETEAFLNLIDMRGTRLND